MDGFEEKLNGLLSDPAAMSQIMQLAQSLGAGQEAPQQTPPQQQQQQQQTPQQTGVSPLSALAGGVDPKLLSRLMPLIGELGSQQDSNARQLLYALRPYLRPERQEKVERALQLARLYHLAKRFLAGWGG